MAILWPSASAITHIYCSCPPMQDTRALRSVTTATVQAKRSSLPAKKFLARIVLDTAVAVSQAKRSPSLAGYAGGGTEIHVKMRVTGADEPPTSLELSSSRPADCPSGKAGLEAGPLLCSCRRRRRRLSLWLYSRATLRKALPESCELPACCCRPPGELLQA